MFRCQSCQTVVPAGTRAQRVVVQTRPKTYEPRGDRPGFDRGSRFRGRRVKKKKVFDQGGTGTEIVRELLVCPSCASRYEAEQAAEAEAAKAAEAATLTEAAADTSAE